MIDNTIWGIHAGKTGDAHNLFLKRKVIALGWSDVGDLSKLEANREAFKEKVSSAYPNMKKGAIPGSGGQLYRFVHVMRPGDLVAYPSKQERQIHIGKVLGEYFYAPAHEKGYPNHRKVEWLKSIPRTMLSQGALYEIGSAMSLFQIKNYADEIYAVLEGKPIVSLEEEDDTIAYVADDIEQVTYEYILRTLSRELKGHPFADFVAHLIEKMGYKTRVSPVGPDGGIDIIAHRDELGFEPPIIKVQVKSSGGNIGEPTVAALYGKVESNEFGMLVTIGNYTKQAINFAKSKSNLRLVNGEDLVNLVYTYYEQFDSRYKGILPLKQVFVPEVVQDMEG